MRINTNVKTAKIKVRRDKRFILFASFDERMDRSSEVTLYYKEYGGTCDTAAQRSASPAAGRSQNRLRDLR
jgi:hypothetical protein